jgi:hypothetical protein
MRWIRHVLAGPEEAFLRCQTLKPSARDLFPAETFQRHVEEEIMIALGGMAAETRLKIPFDAEACSVDVQNARRWLAKLGQADEVSYRSFVRRTGQLLREPRTWRAVRTVARRLVHRGMMSGAAVDAICQELEVPRSKIHSNNAKERMSAHSRIAGVHTL